MCARNYSISYFICSECGNIFPLPRRENKKRNKGHIKDLYCIHCNKVVKTTEIRNRDCYIGDNGNIVY